MELFKVNKKTYLEYIYLFIYWYKEYKVAQLIEALRMADSIPTDVIGIFQFSGHTMVLCPTQPLTEMSTRDISCSRCVRFTTLQTSRADCLDILAASTSWNPQGLSRPVKR